MTHGTARTVANVVLATAGLAAAYVIITTPPLRRLAYRGLTWWLGASVPMYLFEQTRQAWQASNPVRAA
jgi:hypothetical protein